ncbi:hypothetical protein GX48_00739 [Paracoccidioides brasiliensis]|nr:hypothetical protein GX48_00739 [Paracoccidioides brasiliensis]
MTSGPCTRSLGKVGRFCGLEDEALTDICEGPTDNNLISSAPQPLQPEGPIDAATAKDYIANISVNPTSGSDSPNQNGGRVLSCSNKKRDAALQLHPEHKLRKFETSLSKEGDANSSRKKRRKTGTQDSAGQVTAIGPLRRLLIKDNPIPALGVQFESSARNEPDIPEQKCLVQKDSQNFVSSSLPESSQPHLKPVATNTRSDGPPVKTLKLNPNGKLLSSPDRPKNEGPGPEEPSKRKSALLKRDEGQSLVVVLKYGAKKESRPPLGQLINEIICGQKRYPVVKEAPAIAIPNPPPPRPTKPTHPFFMSKSTQKSEEKGVRRESPFPIHPRGGREVQPAIANQPYRMDNSQTVTSGVRSHHPKYSDPIDPIWPPREAVHIRGLPSSNKTIGSFLDFEERKAKGLPTTIPECENILSVQSRLMLQATRRLLMKKILRHPGKRTCSRGSLFETVMNRFGLSLATAQTIGENFPCRRARSPYTSHPAVAQLLTSIRSSTTAFDRGEFDDIPWTHKYAPNGAGSVLQLGTEALLLRKWLQNLIVSTVHTGTGGSDGKQSKQTPDESTKRKKKRKRPRDLDKFIVSSDDESQMDEIDAPDHEDELAGGVTISSKRTVVRSDTLTTDSKSAPEKRSVANSILISGPSGCGKTAAVYAVAKELGFEIFEINAGSRRNAKDVVERVGDMTQNHLVQLPGQVNKNSPATSSLKSMFSTTSNENEMPGNMEGFFKSRTNPVDKKRTHAAAGTSLCGNESVLKSQPSQKQSLILLEEVDVLFEEDKQFWSGVLALISQSKRPIIMTCNDERLLPLEQLKLHAILRFRQSPCDLAADYLFLLAANEGHILDRERLSELYTVMRRDLRATIMQMDFWCQMAVGSKKAGLDWLAKRPLLRDEHEKEADFPKVVSTDTYVHGMGLVGHDIACDEVDSYERRSQLMLECLEQWHMGLMDWHESKILRDVSLGHDGQSLLEALAQESEEADMKGNLDIICRCSPEELTQDVFDPSWPEMTGKQRSTYTEGYQLLQTDPLIDYARLPTKIGVSISVLLETCFNKSSSTDEEAVIQQALEKFSPEKLVYFNRFELRDILEPITVNPDPFNQSSGRQSFSFDNCIAPISEDLAPYIRTIVACDLRLEQQRLALSGLISQDSVGNKRYRTTRASRAALEGGDKASIRKERWFSGKFNPKSVLATGGAGWQDVLGQELQRLGGERGVGGDSTGKGSVDEDECGSSSEEGI